MEIRKLHLDVLKLRREVAGRRMGASIAREMGISNNSVNKWLTGRTKLTIERFNRICEIIGVDADEFVEIKKAA